MTPPPHSSSLRQTQREFDRLALAAGMLAFLVGCLTLIGWLLRIQTLVRIVSIPGAGVMMPNTAIGLLLSGTALGLLRKQATGPSRRRMGQALAVATTLLGLLTLAQYLLGIDLGIDLLLFEEAVKAMVWHLPGRPAPLIALSLSLTGLALLLLDVETRRGWRPAQLLALTIAFLSLQPLLGYAYGEEQLFAPERAISSLPAFSPVAVHTALSLLVLALGLLFARPERGLMAAIMGDDVGGLMARRLLPAAVLLPVLLGGVRLMGERAGLYGTTLGVSMFVVATIVSFVLVIGWNAHALRRLDVERRLAEEARRQSEARFSGIVSIAADAIISIDEEQRITFFNGGAERIFGYRANEVLGQPLDILLPERLRARHRQHTRDFEADSRTSRRMGERQSIVGLRKNGEEFPAEATISKLEMGGAWSFTVILRDISKRKHAEETLQESEERFRTSFEDAPIGMALVDLDGHWRHVNRALCEIVGYSREELRHKTFQDITVLEDLEPDLANARRLLSGELSSYQMEKRYIHKDGHIVSILLTGSLVRDARGEPLYFISQIQDISERKRLERDQRFLAETGPQLASSLDPKAILRIVAGLTVPTLADWCVIHLLDESGRVQEVESTAAEASKEHLLREMLALYPRDPTRHGRIISRVLRTGTPALVPDLPEAALEEVAQDARHLEMLHQLAPRSVMVVPLLPRGRTLGTIVLAASESGRRYDARDLALAEELARRAALAIDNARLYRVSEQAIRVRDEVLRIVAHDLRTPLNVISLSARMLLKRVPEERATERKPLESIQSSVNRATRLIQDLLDVARMEAGRLSVERRPEQTAPIVKEAIELHHALAEAKSLQLAALLPEDCPPILADRDRVLQVLSNLLGNAIKFTPEGGHLILRAEPTGDMMQFTLSDTGPGIPAEELPHLFEPFWQSRRGSRDGAGLGLAIVKGLIEAHGGRIWVESAPGVGSTFSFTLPTAPSPHVQPPPTLQV